MLGFVENNDNGEDEKNVENEMMHWCDRHLCLFIVFVYSLNKNTIVIKESIKLHYSQSNI